MKRDSRTVTQDISPGNVFPLPGEIFVGAQDRARISSPWVGLSGPETFIATSDLVRFALAA